MAELDVGEHCSVLSCKQLDFLPLKCDRCKLCFCKEHHFYDYHDCANFVPRNDGDSKDRGPIYFKCSLPSCPKTELVVVTCSGCRHNFCLQHRLQGDHHCPELSRIQNEKAEKHQRILDSMSISDVVTGPSKILSEKSKLTAAKVNFMKMKMKAVGDGGLPMDQRFYFQVVCPINSSSNFVYFDCQWTIGRTIDALAKMLKVQNKNNQQDAPKLVLTSNEEATECLATSKKWKELLQCQELYNGSVLYLKLLTL